MSEQKPLGRPLIPIDWKSFDKLCALQCKLSEFATFFECSEDTIERACLREKEATFADYFQRQRQHGYIALRRQMFQAVQSGNTSMMIFLAKNWLGMSDKSELTTTLKVSVDLAQQIEERKAELIRMLEDQPKEIEVSNEPEQPS